MLLTRNIVQFKFGFHYITILLVIFWTNSSSEFQRTSPWSLRVIFSIPRAKHKKTSHLERLGLRRHQLTGRLCTLLSNSCSYAVHEMEFVVFIRIFFVSAFSVVGPQHYTSRSPTRGRTRSSPDSSAYCLLVAMSSEVVKVAAECVLPNN